MTEYRLSDSVIGNMVQLLQLAMITGTDLTDHFRMIKLIPSDLAIDKLDLSPSYIKEHEKRMETLLKEAEEIMKKEQENSVGFKN